jgi:hypothetical protein
MGRRTRHTRTMLLLAVALLVLVPGTAPLANPVQRSYVQAELGSTVATIQPGTPGGIDSAGASMGRGHRLGWRRRGCLGRRCLVLTQGTMGLMRQPHKGLEFFGGLAA